MANVVRVAVIQVPTADPPARPKKSPQFLVRPSVVFLQNGDVVRVLNTTPWAVTISKLNDMGTSCPKLDPRELEFFGPARVDPCGARDSNPVSIKSKGSFLCRYQIHVEAVRGKRTLAKGDSDPVIIIDKP